MVLAGDSHADFDTPLLGILYRYRLRTKSIGNTPKLKLKTKRYLLKAQTKQKEDPEG